VPQTLVCVNVSTPTTQPDIGGDRLAPGSTRPDRGHTAAAG